MGRNKALVTYQGRTFLSWVTEAARASGVLTDITAVTGADQAAVEAAASRLSLPTVYNPEFLRGMMTSLQAGVRAVPTQTDAILVMLVDQPLVSAHVIRELVEKFNATHVRHRISLVRPRYRDQCGHPCLIASQHFQELLDAPVSDRGAIFLFKNYPQQAIELQTEDPGVIVDFDSPVDMEDYQKRRP